MSVKNLYSHDLPRERFLKYGVSKLNTYELLAIILGSGTKGNDVLSLAKQVVRLIHKKGDDKIKYEDLNRMRGLGPAKSMQIMAIIAFTRRLYEEDCAEILTPKDVYNLCVDIRSSKREHFVAFYFNTQNQLIERHIISIGTLNASLVHPREVFEPALRLNAAAVIVAHNHPSGSLKYSPQDDEVTERLKNAGELLGIKFLDHIIVTSRGYASVT